MGMTSVLLSDSDTARLEKFCYNTRAKKSQVLRAALTEYLDREEGVAVERDLEAHTLKYGPRPTEEEMHFEDTNPQEYWEYWEAKRVSGWKLTLDDWENQKAAIEWAKRPKWKPEEALSREDSEESVSDSHQAWTNALEELTVELGRMPQMEEVYARLEGHGSSEEEVYRDPLTGETEAETMERLRQEEREAINRGPLGPPED